MRRIIVFPPFIAFVLALVLIPLGGVPEQLQPVLKRLGDVMSPLALFSIGLQIRLGKSAIPFKALAVGLFVKLLVAPALIFFVYKNLFGLRGLVFEVSVLEAAMPSMITGLILASEHGLDPELAASLAAIGIPLSLLTVYLWGMLVI